MRTRTLLTVALVLAPLLAVAQTATPQLFSSTPSATSAAKTTTVAAQAISVCTPPSRKLSRGSSGIDVANLQIFLSIGGTYYPEGTVTGYYGALTEAAVKRFQARFEIVDSGTPASTGYGAVGSRTLAALKNAWQCDDKAALGWFRAQPTGRANEMFFSAQASSSHPLGMTFSIDYGDGTTGNASVTSVICATLAANCSTIISATHQYASPGTYRAAMVAGGTQNQCSGIPISCSPVERSARAGDVTFNTATAAQGTVVAQNGQTAQSASSGSAGASGAGTATAVFSNAGLALSQPIPNAVFSAGDTVPIVWNVRDAPAGATVNLSLKAASTSVIAAQVATGKSVAGSYSWVLPSSSQSCANDTFMCLTELSGNCNGSLCSIRAGAYRIHADLVSNGVVVASADSGAFALGGADGTAALSTLSSASAVSSDAYGTGTSQGTASTAATTPNTTTNSSGVNCKTPWQSQLVANGTQAPYEPFFTNGVYSGNTPIPLMQCTGGVWQKCDWQGANCRAYTQL